MARQITKELAIKIVQKLGARPKTKKNAAHDLYTYIHKGKIIARFGLRRGSEKDKGHDFMPGKLHISPNEAKIFAQCGYDLAWYVAKMTEKGFIEKEPDTAGQDKVSEPQG